jgi:pimeloyl-ACP methyl ester carboxylesterase
MPAAQLRPVRERCANRGREIERMEKTIDGVRFAYDDRGSGQGLVLLHGFPLDRTMWDGQFDALARHARVIRLDLRGSGQSGTGEGPALMEALAGDVYGLLDALEVERVVIAGHSMGGYVALAFFRMYAERVAGLALVASHVGADTPARALARVDQAAQVLNDGMASMAEAMIANLLAPQFAAANRAEVARLRGIAANQHAAGAAAQIIGMKERVDSADLLEDIAVPTLIVGGQSDRLIVPAALEETAGAIADCEYVALPGVGHLPPIEAPAQTTAALERLLERCELSSAADPRSARAGRA